MCLPTSTTHPDKELIEISNLIMLWPNHVLNINETGLVIKGGYWAVCCLKKAYDYLSHSNLIPALKLLKYHGWELGKGQSTIY